MRNLLLRDWQGNRPRLLWSGLFQFCFTCARRWNETEIKRKQHRNKIIVLFQFRFSSISHVRAAACEARLSVDLIKQTPDTRLRCWTEREVRPKHNRDLATTTTTTTTILLKCNGALHSRYSIVLIRALKTVHNSRESDQEWFCGKRTYVLSVVCRPGRAGRRAVRYLLIEETLGTFSWSQMASDSSRSRISHANMVAFSRLYLQIASTTRGVATLGLLPPITPGLIEPVS